MRINDSSATADYAATYDALIVGAGINGAVSAAALSSRGLKVMLVDQGDVASMTSQQSSNLVWGGIKYLQSYEFWLVFKLCLARSRLMRQYPNRVKSVGFIAAVGPNAPFGPALATLGTLTYWAIGLFKTPAPKTFGRKAALKLEPKFSTNRLRGAVRYFDGMLPDNDSRFVWDFVAKAIGFGARVRTYLRVESATRVDGVWNVRVTDELTGSVQTLKARSVVNAAGPLVQDVLESSKVASKTGLAFSKGIHLVVSRLTEDDRVLAFWDEEGRLFYVIPMGDRSVIGTTDTRVTDPFVEVTDADREFVLRQINRSMNLETPLTKASIIAERCGVRSLVLGQNTSAATTDWHKLSRKHVVEVDRVQQILSIFGGKLTDCLNVGDEVIAHYKKMGYRVGQAKKWFGEDVGKMPPDFIDLIRGASLKVSSADRLAEGLWRRHGVRAHDIVQSRSEPLEEVFEGLGISYSEVSHVIRAEMVVSADDLLRRRLPIAMTRSAADVLSNTKLQDILRRENLV
jgi:glycerol-3-phosphate dehydrogenase